MNGMDELLSKLHELSGQGVTEDDLYEELLQWSKEHRIGENLGLHDFFNVSEEEEASWYDESSRRFRSFNGVLKLLQEKGRLDARIGYERKALRKYRTEAREFFLHWISMVEDLCSKTVFGEMNYLGAGTLDTFETVCYFAAENHDSVFFEPILTVFKAIHRSEEEDRYTPLSTLVYQQLSSIFYNLFEGDIEEFMNVLLDPAMDREINKVLGDVLAQFALDGAFSEEKHQELLDRYIDFIFEYDRDGDAAAQWIARAGKSKVMKKKLRKLLERYVNPEFYMTCDTREFTEMVEEDPRPLCKKGIVMDDMILNGMYLPAIHAPEAIREKAVREQEERIQLLRETATLRNR